MKIIISGGTGFIGSHLKSLLLKEGHLVTVITRSPEQHEHETAHNQQFVSWEHDALVDAVEGSDVVINLAGASIFGQRWTEEVKRKIRSSRIEATEALVKAAESSEEKPRLMISVSGVDYYGDGGDRVLDEESPPGDYFLSEVCVEWEQAARQVTEAGVRLAIPRLGIVLERDGGALQQMLPPFRLFVGGPIGSGDQYFPWIHMDDLCRGLLWPIFNPDFEGAYNLCAPDPATMDEFARILGRVMHRPSLFRVPAFALKLVLGEAAKPVLYSHRTVPKKLRQSGFEFLYRDLREALADIV